jgi:polyisoprenoid-binding protein YceI
MLHRSQPQEEAGPMGRVGKLVIAGLVVLAAGGGWWLLAARGSDAPAPAARGSDAPAPAALTAPPPSATTSQPGATGSPDGSWKVRDGSGSFVGYRVREQLAFFQSPSVAVGRTSAVTGSIQVSGGRLDQARIQADLRQLTSDQSRRDNAIRQRGLQSDQFPDATFELTQPIALPADLGTGRTVRADAKGRLTVHGTTREVTLPLQGRWSGDTIQVAGSLPITMTDYGIQPPQFGPVVSIDDSATMELQLVFVRG